MVTAHRPLDGDYGAVLLAAQQQIECVASVCMLKLFLRYDTGLHYLLDYLQGDCVGAELTKHLAGFV